MQHPDYFIIQDGGDRMEVVLFCGIGDSEGFGWTYLVRKIRNGYYRVGNGKVSVTNSGRRLVRDLNPQLLQWKVCGLIIMSHGGF